MPVASHIATKLHDTLDGAELTHANLVGMMMLAIEMVDTYRFPGPRKKEIVILSLKKLVEISRLSDDMYDEYNIFLTYMAGNVVDSIISAANGRYNIKRTQRHIFSSLIKHTLKSV